MCVCEENGQTHRRPERGGGGRHVWAVYDRDMPRGRWHRLPHFTHGIAVVHACATKKTAAAAAVGEGLLAWFDSRFRASARRRHICREYSPLAPPSRAPICADSGEKPNAEASAGSTLRTSPRLPSRRTWPGRSVNSSTRWTVLGGVVGRNEIGAPIPDLLFPISSTAPFLAHNVRSSPSLLCLSARFHPHHAQPLHRPPFVECWRRAREHGLTEKASLEDALRKNRPELREGGSPKLGRNRPRRAWRLTCHRHLLTQRSGVLLVADACPNSSSVRPISAQFEGSRFELRGHLADLFRRAASRVGAALRRPLRQP